MRQTKGRRMRFVMEADGDLGNAVPPQPQRSLQAGVGERSKTPCSKNTAALKQGRGTIETSGNAAASFAVSAPVSFEDLMFSERFIIWAARFWNILNSHEYKSLNPLADAFRIAKSPGALGPFDAVMTVITLKSARPFEFHEQWRRGLSGDEKRLLFLTAAKPGRMRDAVSSHLLRCQGTALLRPLLAQLGEELAGADLRPPRRVWDFPEVIACADLFPAMDP